MDKLEQGFFDLILLDMKGVGKGMAKDQGLGLLRHIKSANSTQIIIAYSGATFSLKDKVFFDLADSTLAKTADYVDFKREVDECLRRRFSIEYHLARLEDLAAARGADRSAIRKAAQKALDKRDSSVLEKSMGKMGLGEDAINIGLQIIQVAIGVAQLLVGGK